MALTGEVIPGFLEKQISTENVILIFNTHPFPEAMGLLDLPKIDTFYLASHVKNHQAQAFLFCLGVLQKALMKT